LAPHSSASSREGTSTIANPPMTALVSGYGPSVTIPSVATMLALWLSTPPPKIHTPASWASRATACAASPTAGPFYERLTPDPTHWPEEFHGDSLERTLSR